MYKVKENFQKFSLMLQRDIRNIKVTKVKQNVIFFFLEKFCEHRLFYFHRACIGNFYILAGKKEKFGLGDNPVRWINDWLKSSYTRILIDGSLELCAAGLQYKI